MYERFQEILEEKGLRAKDVTDATGIKSATLSAWKKGQYTPKQDKLALIADFLGVSLQWLMGLTDIRTQKNEMSEVRIPVLGQVRAGDCTTYAEEDVIDTIEISASKAKTGEFFGLKIKGDSMNPSLMDGDIVIVRKQSTISRMQELKPAPSAVVLKSIVGHKSNDVTVDVYTRIRIEEKLNCVNRLEWLE